MTALPTHVAPDRARVLMERLRLRGPVIGVDEAGRGPLAGPVMGAAVCLSRDQEAALLALGLRDSKRMTPRGRERVFRAMRELGVFWRAQPGGVGRIERDNILQAALWAMGRSALRLAALLPAAPYVVVDGPTRLLLDLPQWPLVGADALLPVVSAASVVAKVLRDRLMTLLDRRYPGYDLARHKGYPTAAHREKIRLLGLSPIHRPSFCRRALGGAPQAKGG